MPVEMTAAAEKLLRTHAMRGRKSARWGRHARDPEARAWIDAFTRYSASQPNKRLTAADQTYVRLLDFLAEKGPIPAIEAVSRKVHITGSGGFLQWLKHRYSRTSQQPAKITSQLRCFFDWQTDSTDAQNPISKHDVPRGPARNNKSSKVLTPHNMIHEARTVVRELIAFAHAQADGDSGPCFGGDTENAGLTSPCARPDPADHALWAVDAATAALLPSNLHRPSNFMSQLVTHKNADGTTRRVLSPVMPTLLLLLLTIPLRGIQARLLDSGEADEFTCCPKISTVAHPDDRTTYEVEFMWEPNHHRLALKSRRQGVIRRYVDGQNDGFLGFYVNTNKTQISGEKNRDRGYDIPWQHPEMLDRLNRLRAWQGRYNPADCLLTLNDVSEVESNLEPSPAIGQLPGHVFLFRRYDEHNLAFRQLPATTTDCSTFFASVLDEVEARLRQRIAADNAAEPDPKKRREPPVLVLNRSGRRPKTCVYTLHSLRLTGITAFAEAGVPAAIIAEFLSGHLTLLLAVYYMKFGPATMTRVLGEAERLIQSGALDETARMGGKADVNALLQQFVSEGETAVRSACDELPGFWKWSIDGICPNGMTRCEMGGPPVQDSKRRVFAPVEGGTRNCPMCRFWLTGPRFVAGQIIMANATLHRARSLSLTLQGLWVQQQDPAKVKNVAWTKDRIDKAEAELNVVLRTLNARVRLLEKSLAVARQGATEAVSDDVGNQGGTLDLITRMRDTDVHVTARQTSQLGYLEFMSRAVRLFPEIEAHDAPIELGVAIDRLLDENDFRGLLYRLPEDMRTKAGIAFMDCIRSEAPAEVPEDEFVDQVARGERKLFTFDVRKIEAEMSRAAGRAMLLEPILAAGVHLEVDASPRALEQQWQ